MTEKNKEYQVQAVVKTSVSVPVWAKTLEEAIEKSKGLKDDDFVEVIGEHIDGDFRITGVYESAP
jgi:hypothetical protein